MGSPTKYAFRISWIYIQQRAESFFLALSLSVEFVTDSQFLLSQLRMTEVFASFAGGIQALVHTT